VLESVSNPQSPRVSVVTPVYNGARYLAECIESVLEQSYGDFEYVVLDNASTDETPTIVRRYQARDARIRYARNEQLLPIMDNWNAVMRLIDPASTYCKMVHADDRLFPRCLEEMVGLADAHPSVVVVGAYRIDGDKPSMIAVPYPRDVVPGAELCRNRLLGLWADLFGSPTSIMYRADAVRSRPQFFDPDNLHGDTEVCFELLRHGDYGFVHQLLTFTRRHEGAETVEVRRHGTHSAARIIIARRYGPYFLSQEEQKRAVAMQIRYHYDFLGGNVRRLLDRTFRDRQVALLRKCGLEMNPARVVLAALRRSLRQQARRLRRVLRI
jgi:glycosyltransferase involved in cell wall biosynthesis